MPLDQDDRDWELAHADEQADGWEELFALDEAADAAEEAEKAAEEEKAKKEREQHFLSFKSPVTRVASHLDKVEWSRITGDQVHESWHFPKAEDEGSLATTPAGQIMA